MRARERNVRIASILGGEVIPEWPDFGVEKMPADTKRGYDIWRASTDTHRPGTPVFSVFVTGSGLDEATARELLGAKLRDAHAKAHPNGCP